MLAVWLEDGKLELREDLATPQPPRGEALVRVVCAGICNTDVELLRGYYPFDNEGVATRSRDIVEDGVLAGYLLSAYSARRLGLKTTGNAGGARNLFRQDVHDGCRKHVHTEKAEIVAGAQAGHDGVNNSVGLRY